MRRESLRQRHVSGRSGRVHLCLPRRLASTSSYTCTGGYEGRNCEVEVDECSASPCRNAGICQDLVAGFECSCPAGYTGATCQTDVNECAASPCLHNGVCANTAGSFACNCTGTGYTGKTCSQDVDECSTGPCLHGGTCTNSAGAYTCNCAGTGYSGATCQTNVNDCSPNPCQNGGACSDGVNGYTCNCAGTGYSGTTCQTNVNDCSPNPCQNAGTCTDGVNSYLCACTGGYGGRNCEHVIFQALTAAAGYPACRATRRARDRRLDRRDDERGVLARGLERRRSTQRFQLSEFVDVRFGGGDAREWKGTIVTIVVGEGRDPGAFSVAFRWTDGRCAGRIRLARQAISG